MSEASLAKARLIEMKADLKTELPKGEGGKNIEVQFNPDSLKVTFANQIAQPSGGDQSSGTGGRQFVGSGTTKLALTLWFDVTAPMNDPVEDVRKLTKDVIHFITPKDSSEDKDKKLPPAARFVWGSFIFDGMVEGLEESIEFFSPQGVPLRASVAITMSQQKILVSDFSAGTENQKKVGQYAFKPAKQGDSIQGMAEMAGRGSKKAAPTGPAGQGGQDWQSIAAGNNIEDPLRLPTGALVNLNKRAPVGGGLALGGQSSLPALTGARLSPSTPNLQPPRPRLGLG